MNVSSVKNLNGEVFSAVQDASLTNVVQSNSAQWGQGGGGSVSSKYGTITVDGNDIEATNKAIEFKSNGFTSSFDAIVLDEYNPPRSITWDNYSQGTTLTFNVLNGGNSDTLAYSSNTNVTGLITAAQYTPTNVSLPIPNATAIQFSADHSYTLDNIQVSATSSIQVKELAWKTDLPTYNYNSDKKLSAINGSALVGNEDYLVQQGFVQNLTSPHGTVNVKNNKVEATNSAVKGDGVDGFVSAYNGVSVYPGNSATLSWANYVPNTILHVSGGQFHNNTLTYSADTSVTGQITLPENGETSIEVPTDATSIVIGNEDWSNTAYNFTVSAADYYEIGVLAWKSDVPTFEHDTSAIDSVVNNVQTNSGVWGGSALPISAGPGIKFEMVDNTLVASTQGPILDKITIAGTWNGHEVKQMLQSGIFETNVNGDVIPVNSAYSAASSKWIDPANSYIQYGSTSNILPSTWVLGATGRLGSLSLLNGIVKVRSNDTTNTQCTAFVTIKWCEN